LIEHLKSAVTDITPKYNPTADEAFEEMYVAVRDKEGRLYNDKQVAALPDIDAGHRYYKEWKLRKHSAEQLIDSLRKERKSLNILEVGCGNGWLSAKLAGIPNAKVTGIDPNRIEINQAIRVFKKPNLKFIHGAFSADSFNGGTKFDVIVFAASIQYFPVLKDVVKNAFDLLSANGRIHVLDTHFYHAGELEMAAERSLGYFASLGYSQMAPYYFHHLLKDAMHFKHKLMFDPTTLLNRLKRQGIFYWIKLKP
jgi:ubiquinone/menaquinone biosynthesis C-methylase UbiE